MKNTYFVRLQNTDHKIIDEQTFDDLASALSWSNTYGIIDNYEVQITRDHRCIISYLHQPAYTGQ